jgi:F-type H+-transporting ATPase subunit b
LILLFAVTAALCRATVSFAVEDSVAGSAPAAAGAEAAGGEHQVHFKWGTFGLQLLNFGVLVTVLVWGGGRAVNRALLARHQQLKTDLAAAAEARAAAELRLKKQEQRLASLEHEIEAIRTGIRQEAEAEKARLIAAAEERARRMLDDASFTINQQVKDAEISLRHEVAEAAVKVAEELVKRSFDVRDQQRLLDTFVREVASGDGAGDAAGALPPGPPSGRDGAPRREL